MMFSQSTEAKVRALPSFSKRTNRHHSSDLHIRHPAKCKAQVCCNPWEANCCFTHKISLFIKSTDWLDPGTAIRKSLRTVTVWKQLFKVPDGAHLRTLIVLKCVLQAIIGLSSYTNSFDSKSSLYRSKNPRQEAGVAKEQTPSLFGDPLADVITVAKNFVYRIVCDHKANIALKFRQPYIISWFGKDIGFSRQFAFVLHSTSILWRNAGANSKECLPSVNDCCRVSKNSQPGENSDIQRAWHWWASKRFNMMFSSRRRRKQLSWTCLPTDIVEARTYQPERQWNWVLRRALCPWPLGCSIVAVARLRQRAQLWIPGQALHGKDLQKAQYSGLQPRTIAAVVPQIPRYALY